MVVFPGPTYYQAIDQDRLARIVSEHFVGGRPVAEYFWTGVRKRIIPGDKPNLRPIPMPAQPMGDRESRQQATPQKPKRPIREADDFKW